MRKFYKNITFDTHKERHDNFSFNKAIKTKQALNDTMHFQNLLNKPTEPLMIVYQKQRDNIPNIGTASQNAESHYQNDNYVNMSENSTMYNEFKKRMELPGGSAGQMGMSNYSGFSGLGQNGVHPGQGGIQPGL